MIAHALHRSRWSLVALTAAAALAGCDDDKSAFAPTEPPAIAAASRGVDLGQCTDLGAPEGSKLVFHAYAEGVQIYRWDGAGWTPVGPSAQLFADAKSKALVGTHYSGPTWKSTSGSTVVGEVVDRCTPNPDAIPWLLLRGAKSAGPGVFLGVTHIQRVNTVGGKAPAQAGTVSQVREVPYTADYFFYRAP
jgi:uncharacterized protein DUF3455